MVVLYVSVFLIRNKNQY